MHLNSKTKTLLCWLFVCLVVFIGSIFVNQKNNQIYAFDYKYSIFVQNINDISYTKLREIKINNNITLLLSKIAAPVFIRDINGKYIYLSEKCEIIENICANKNYKLIELICDENLSMIPEIYKSFKNWNLISMKLIDNRRWQIVVMKNNSIITIDFPSGIPNVKEFENLDAKYQLTKNYKNIDLRFKNKIGVID